MTNPCLLKQKAKCCFLVLVIRWIWSSDFYIHSMYILLIFISILIVDIVISVLLKRELRAAQGHRTPIEVQLQGYLTDINDIKP